MKHDLIQRETRFGTVRLHRDDSQVKRYSVDRFHPGHDGHEGVWLSEDRFKTHRAAKRSFQRWMEL